ncbi:MAG: hypothetical protein DI562_04305 [Stenotrophomonas acidaminiphila]|jgi:hypothetical protein|nr:MAG: hypothetical protein DI562_04305 [Stenotrophomonas acidaminiphila]
MHVYRFTSNLFEVEPGEDEEINPRMYGRQLAGWLKARLDQRGQQVECIVAEDWGRCLMIGREEFALWVGCGSSPDYDTAKQGDPPPPKESIVWHCFAEAELTAWQRLVKRLDATHALEKLDCDLREILSNEPAIQLFEAGDHTV